MAYVRNAGHDSCWQLKWVWDKDFKDAEIATSEERRKTTDTIRDTE
jgi:hypothetical protein